MAVHAARGLLAPNVARVRPRRPAALRCVAQFLNAVALGQITPGPVVAAVPRSRDLRLRRGVVATLLASGALGVILGVLGAPLPG